MDPYFVKVMIRFIKFSFELEEVTLNPVSILGLFDHLHSLAKMQVDSHHKLTLLSTKSQQ